MGGSWVSPYPLNGTPGPNQGGFGGHPGFLVHKGPGRLGVWVEGD